MFESLDSVLLPEHLDHFGFYVPSQSNHQSNHQSVSDDEYWMDNREEDSNGLARGPGLAPGSELARGPGLAREASVWVYGHEVAQELAALKVGSRDGLLYHIMQPLLHPQIHPLIHPPPPLIIHPLVYSLVHLF